MTVEPYSKARRVFLIVDNGSAHRGQRSIDRLQGAWPNLRLVHTPVHASWVNQAEIYFSVTQRKVLQPNNFPDLDTLERTLLAFGRHYEQIAQPFEWKFTRADLDQSRPESSTAPPPKPPDPNTSANFRAARTRGWRAAVLFRRGVDRGGPKRGSSPWSLSRRQ